MSKCIGCGAKIQTSNPMEPGYTPVSATVDHGDQVYCQRCYGIKHHNLDYSKMTYEKMTSIETLNNMAKDYYHKIAYIKGREALILLMIDVMDIYSGFISNLADYVGNNPVIILVNKTDVLPKSLKLGTLTELIKTIGVNDGLNVREVIYISAIKQANIEQLMKKVRAYFTRKNYPGTETYVIGVTSVGKSTLINTILKIYGEAKNDVITTSNQHQTTVDIIKIPIGVNSKKETCYLIDTPGMINLQNISTYLTQASIKVLSPRQFIKPRTYQLKGEQTFLIGALARIDLAGDEISASFLVSNDLYLHRTKTENADKVLESSRYTLLVPPYDEEERSHLNEMISKSYQLSCDEETKHWDIAIAGIGYIHLSGTNFKIRITLPKDILLTVVPDLF